MASSDAFLFTWTFMCVTEPNKGERSKIKKVSTDLDHRIWKQPKIYIRVPVSVNGYTGVVQEKYNFVSYSFMTISSLQK